jgi:hypothetical protein
MFPRKMALIFYILTFIFYFMLYLEPELECIPVPVSVSLRQKVAVPVPAYRFRLPNTGFGARLESSGFSAVIFCRSIGTGYTNVFGK